MKGVDSETHSEGNGTINAYFPAVDFRKNVLIKDSTSTPPSYPTDTFFPADIPAVKFDNYAAGDYQLVPGISGSPFNVTNEPCTGTTHDLGIFDWTNLAAAENAREDDL